MKSTENTIIDNECVNTVRELVQALSKMPMDAKTATDNHLDSENQHE